MSSEWPTVQLSDCAEFQEGYVNPSQRNSDFFDGPIKWLRAVDLNDSVVSDTTRTLSEKGFRSAGKSALLFEPGSLAISKSGTIGRLGILEDYMCGNRAVINIRVNHSICDKHYIFYVLKSKRAEIESLATGSVQKNLYTSVLGSMELDLPPLETQKAIASQLWALDKKIQHNHQINQTLEQMAQAIFKSWFVDFEPVKAKIAALEAGGSEDDALLAAMQAIAGSALFATDAADADAQTQLARLQTEHPEQYATLRATAELFPSAMQESELGEIPEGWSVCQVENILERLKPVKRYTKKEVSSTGLVPVFEQGADILLGFHNEKAGFTADAKNPAFVFGDHTCITHLSCQDFDISQNVIPLRGRNRSTIWVYYAIQGKQAFQEYRRHWSELIVKPVIYPTRDICERYSETVLRMICFKESLERENRSLAELRDTLLPKLLSGEIDVSALADNTEANA